MSDHALLSKWGATVHASGGVLWMSSGDVIDSRKKNFAAFGSASVNYPLWERTILTLQIDAHTALYRSNLDELGEASAQFTLGGSYYFSPSSQLDLAFVEDLTVDSSPDAVFQIAYRKTY